MERRQGRRSTAQHWRDGLGGVFGRPFGVRGAASRILCARVSLAPPAYHERDSGETVPPSSSGALSRVAFFLLLILVQSATDSVWAHGGGLDKNGCHTNRKTGDYHCHRGTAPPAPRVLSAPANHYAPAGASAPARYVPARAFVNCAEARTAGAAPVRRGDPGYGPHLDRDGDGVGCEPYRGR